MRFKLWHYILLLTLSFLAVQWIFIPTSEASEANLADLDVIRDVMRICALFYTSFFMLIMEWSGWAGEREREKREDYRRKVHAANLYEI
jgi:hypothetical protein